MGRNTILAAGQQARGLTISNPPTQAEVQAIADLLDQVLTYLRRE